MTNAMDAQMMSMDWTHADDLTEGDQTQGEPAEWSALTLLVPSPLRAVSYAALLQKIRDGRRELWNAAEEEDDSPELEGDEVRVSVSMSDPESGRVLWRTRLPPRHFGQIRADRQRADQDEDRMLRQELRERASLPDVGPFQLRVALEWLHEGP